MTPSGGKRPGAGRKAGNPMIMYSIRVPTDLKEALDKIGADKVRKALIEIVKEKPP